MGEKKKILEISAETKLLYGALSKAETGEFFSYSRLSALISMDVQGRGRRYLDRARHMCLVDDEMVFGVVFNEGLRRLEDSEIVSVGEGTIGRIRRSLKRGVRKLSCINIRNLDNEGKVRMNIQLSVMGVISHVTRRKSVALIESRVRQHNDRLSIGTTLEEFRKEDSFDK